IAILEQTAIIAMIAVWLLVLLAFLKPLKRRTRNASRTRSHTAIIAHTPARRWAAWDSRRDCDNRDDRGMVSSPTRVSRPPLQGFQCADPAAACRISSRDGPAVRCGLLLCGALRARLRAVARARPGFPAAVGPRRDLSQHPVSWAGLVP